MDLQGLSRHDGIRSAPRYAVIYKRAKQINPAIQQSCPSRSHELAQKALLIRVPYTKLSKLPYGKLCQQ